MAINRIRAPLDRSPWHPGDLRAMWRSRAQPSSGRWHLGDSERIGTLYLHKFLDYYYTGWGTREMCSRDSFDIVPITLLGRLILRTDI